MSIYSFQESVLQRIIRRLGFIAVLLYPLASAQHTGIKGEDKTFWRLAEWVWRFSNLHFFDLLATFVPFC
ncbi:hypothetical protein H5410_014162 [Solanum commersonii]|uniref:Uncharacterized protein n=1 Tax=Solanum commersonii TaxID=4109 RepID=A0A9J5ZQJ8_SOLCO|nr:hypothetical protein H5410_014162 [Solanum commersonii]